MSLADRLESVRRSQQPTEPRRPPSAPAANGGRGLVDPSPTVKASVHQALIDSLGPAALRPAPRPERARAARCGRRCRRSSTPRRRRSRSPTARGSPRRSPTRSSATGRSSRCCATARSPRSWSTAPTTIYVERAGKLYPVDAHFSIEAHLRRTIDKIVGRVGRRVDEASPLVDARLPDGSRVNAVIPPIALDGSMLTIRKFAHRPVHRHGPDRLRHLHAAGPRLPRRPVSVGRRNIIISGGTGSGKTTLLNVISSLHPRRTSASSPSRTPPSSSSTRTTCCGWSRAPSNIEGRGADRRSASWSRTRCVCAPTASSSVRSVTAPRSTCSRR